MFLFSPMTSLISALHQSLELSVSSTSNTVIHIVNKGFLFFSCLFSVLNAISFENHSYKLFLIYHVLAFSIIYHILSSWMLFSYLNSFVDIFPFVFIVYIFYLHILSKGRNTISCLLWFPQCLENKDSVNIFWLVEITFQVLGEYRLAISISTYIYCNIHIYDYSFIHIYIYVNLSI